MSKVFLKKNWAETFIFGDETPGIFVGRKDELENLKFALLNNDSGAILISAVRGVGKTSFVHKALSEIKEKITPIFVNSGHVMCSLPEQSETDKVLLTKKALLTSLIRAAYFEFKDNEIEEIYHKAIGKFKEFKAGELSNEVVNSKEIDLGKEYNLKNLVVLFGTVLATIGITLDATWLNVLGYIGLLGIPVTFAWKKKWITNIKETFGHETVIEDSIDYIEFLFETWLKKKKNKKLVFVIDELDKVEENSAFNLIKEYKNLFSRSCAHFIFIAGPNAYQLTKRSRELSPADGGTFPTLFTHSYYLPLPTTEELREYLASIFERGEQSDDINDLKNYLLFHAQNDFFALKNLVNDLVTLENGRAFLDTDHVKSIDLFYNRAMKVYNYAALFCEKKYRRVKKFWETNSQMQKRIFAFLNDNIGASFIILTEEQKPDILGLLECLRRFGIIVIVPEDEIEDVEVNKTSITYNWTDTYKDIDQIDQLFEEEKVFLEKFNELISLANDLNYISKGEKYQEVFKGYDGEEITNLSLYSVYENYLDLRERVQDPKKRMGVLLEDVKIATEEISKTINSVNNNLLEITSNAVELALKGKNNFYLNQTFAQRPNAFSPCNDFRGVFPGYDHKLFGTETGSREVLLVEDFDDFERIQHGLSMMNNNRDLLIINIITSQENPYPAHPTIYEDKIGRKRKKGMVVNNFYNYIFNGNISSLKSYVYRVIQYFQYY